MNKHEKKLIGRKVQINGLYANIFTGYNRITDFTLYKMNDTTPFVSFDTLIADVSLYRLFAHELKVNEITLVNPLVNVWQKGEIFNFNDLLERNASDTTQTTLAEDTVKQSSSLAIALFNINLRGGHLL